MPPDERYRQQVALLVRALPFVAEAQNLAKVVGKRRADLVGRLEASLAFKPHANEGREHPD